MFLYNGAIASSVYGLLYWGGVESEKHSGQLKRICGPIISLLLWVSGIHLFGLIGVDLRLT